MFRLHDVYFSFGHMDFMPVPYLKFYFELNATNVELLFLPGTEFQTGVANIIGLK